MKRVLSMLALVAMFALTACGGGGGGGDTSTGGGSPTDGGSPLPGTPLATDPVAIVSSAVPFAGRVPSGHARDFTAKYHGPASEGELMEISVNFATLTTNGHGNVLHLDMQSVPSSPQPGVAIFVQQPETRSLDRALECIKDQP